MPSFVKLLKDNEAEVRTAIAGQIPGFCSLVDRAILLNEIMGSIEDLVSDSSQHVRAALGTQISGLAPILGKQEYVRRKPSRVVVCFANYRAGLSTISSLCSFRCSRMSSPKFACTSFRSWSWSTKVSNSQQPVPCHKINICSYRYRPALAISATRNCPACRRQTMACSLGHH